MIGNSALIGHTGFVGSTLMRQRTFAAHFNSSTIAQIRGQRFDTVICAGAPAQKWIANKDPQADRNNLEALMGHLSEMTCSTFVLISTVDVFANSRGKTEASDVTEGNSEPYGLHRYQLEMFAKKRFARCLVIRLPGLVGPGLRKNVIYDFAHNNRLEFIDARGVFQFYPMVNLSSDIQTALERGLDLVHLTAEPISVGDVAREGFGMAFTNVTANTPAEYDFQTTHAEAFGGRGRYTYNRRESLLAIRAYAQHMREPRQSP